MKLLTEVDPRQLRELCRSEEFFWLDLSDPSRDTLREVANLLDIHPLALEDTQEFGQRPKVDAYGPTLLLVYFGAGWREEQPVPVEVHLHISGHFVLSVHRMACQRFDEMRGQLERRPPESEHEIVFRVIDALTDSILDVLDTIAEIVDDHESKVFDRPRARDRDEMAVLRRSLGTLRRVLVIQRQGFERMVERINQLPGLSGDAGTYWRDVGDHMWRALDEVEAARDSLQGILESYTNEVQERLTVVATIFLPLTVLTGFFGQNFNWLITHIGSAWTFWGIGVGGLIASASGIFFWLVHSGLYQSRGDRRRPRVPTRLRRPPADTRRLPPADHDGRGSLTHAEGRSAEDREARLSGASGP